MPFLELTASNGKKIVGFIGQTGSDGPSTPAGSPQTPQPQVKDKREEKLRRKIEKLCVG